MSARLKARYDAINLDLIRMSTVRLIDDTRVRLVVPLRPATATIAEILAAKGVR